MQHEVYSPQFQTLVFSLLLLAVTVLTLKKREKNSPIFPPKLTAEIKGFAILTIIFGHIGYFLDTQDKFLYPLSIASGVGVNIFLFLSGYGLTVSTLKRKLSLLGFYKKRLLRVFIPMWIVLITLLLLDWLVLGKIYEQKTILQNLAGFFPVADIYTSVNSVLWYFTFILFYYIVFSLFTVSKKLLYIAPLGVFYLSHLLLTSELPVTINKDVLTLYELHVYAFPFGIAAAMIPSYLKLIPKAPQILASSIHFTKQLPLIINFLLLAIFGYIFIYTSFNSGIGEEIETEQMISMISTVSLIAFFILKRFTSKFLEIIGIYSYEIYLLHWPLVYRYDFLYERMPAFLATALYIIILLGLGFLLQKLTDKISKLAKLD